MRIYLNECVDNLHMTTDNKKRVFKPLSSNYSNACLQQLAKIGLVSPLNINSDGYEQPFKSSMHLFHPKRHIPPTNPTNDTNMSPIEGYTVTSCRSMQNTQMLTECDGVNK